MKFIFVKLVISLFVILFLRHEIAFADKQELLETAFIKESISVRIYKNLKNTELNSVKVKLQNENRNIKIIEKENLTFDVIENIKIRDYLAGVVSKEMPLSWPLEALKSQAVIARSYMYAKLAMKRGDGYDLESDHMDQVFSWTKSNRAYLAVDNTHGEVLVYNLGVHQPFEIVKAYYHSDCGGHTVPASLVWPGAVDTGTAKDKSCAIRHSNQWQYKMMRSKQVNYSHFKKYKDKILFIAETSIQKLRERIGFHLIKNSPSEIEVGADFVLLKGRGYGHGAGLCQWGSRDLALQGFTHIEILKHYYPKVVMKKFNSILNRKSLTELKINQTIVEGLYSYSR